MVKITLFINFFIFVFGSKMFSLDSVNTYFYYKYEAEVNILNGNYSLAKDSYQKAFQFKKPFSRDLYNCLLVSYMVLDSSTAIDMYAELIRRGHVDDDLLGESNLFIEIKSNKTFYNSLKNGSVNVYFDSVIYNPIIHILDSIYIVDQEIRKNVFDKVGFEVRWIDSTNLVFLGDNFSMLMEHAGFIAGKKLLTNKNFSNRISYEHPFMLFQTHTYIHYKLQKKINFPFFDSFYNSVHQGLIEPGDFFLDYEMLNLTSLTKIFLPHNYKNKENILVEELDTINTYRFNNKLEKLEEFILKYKYMKEKFDYEDRSLRGFPLLHFTVFMTNYMN